MYLRIWLDTLAKYTTKLGTCVGFGPTQLPVGPNPNPNSKPNPNPNPNPNPKLNPNPNPKWIDRKLGGPEVPQIVRVVSRR